MTHYFAGFLVEGICLALFPVPEKCPIDYRYYDLHDESESEEEGVPFPERQRIVHSFSLGAEVQYQRNELDRPSECRSPARQVLDMTERFGFDVKWEDPILNIQNEKPYKPVEEYPFWAPHITSKLIRMYLEQKVGTNVPIVLELLPESFGLHDEGVSRALRIEQFVKRSTTTTMVLFTYIIIFLLPFSCFHDK